MLDGIHHLFDADWFGGFFNILLLFAFPKLHLLLLCRSKPPNPLWRLRSKQLLGRYRRKTLAFNRDETDNCSSKQVGRSRSRSRAHSRGNCSGAVSKLLPFISGGKPANLTIITDSLTIFASERNLCIIQLAYQVLVEAMQDRIFFSGQNCFRRALFPNSCSARGLRKSCKPT